MIDINVGIWSNTVDDMLRATVCTCSICKEKNKVCFDFENAYVYFCEDCLRGLAEDLKLAKVSINNEITSKLDILDNI